MNTTHIPARDQLAKLAEALYRFASTIDSSFSAYLKGIAVELAGALGAGDEEAIAGILARANGVLALGEKLGAIAANDVQVIAAAIDRSRGLALPIPAKQVSSVEVFAEIANQGEVAPAQEEVSQRFVSEKVAAPAPVVEQVKEVQQERVAGIRQTAAPAQKEAVLTASDRQARIVAVIRQNPNVRMRDLLAALPGVSERTIRYDIERLVATGVIEREGVGGPATWYRVRAGVTR